MLGSLGESQYSTLEVVNIITSLVSLVGILFVLGLMISVGVFGYKKKTVAIFHTISFQKLSFYIISFIFVSDLFRMIGHLLPVPSSSLPSFYSEFSCRPGAFFKLFGSISTFLWMNITSYFVYKLLLYPHKFDKFYIQRIKRIFHCISWPIALVISMVPLALKEYTVARSDGPWCFIDTHDPIGMTVGFLCYYLWLIVCWLIIILVYIAISKLLIKDYQKAKQYNTDSINISNHNNIITKVPTIQRLQLFPLIFIFCWFWEILSITYNRWTSHDLYIIKCFQSVFTNLYGAFNAILFVYIIYNYSSNSVIYRNPKTIGKRKKRKSKLSKKRRNNHNNNEDQGIAVTTTNTNTLCIHKETENEEMSGPTVSLGVGNLSVMSPTSMSDQEQRLMLRDDDEDVIDNVIIGYNEDDSDQFYSDDRNAGNIVCDDEDTESAKVISDRTRFRILRNVSETTVHNDHRVNDDNSSDGDQF